MSESSLSLRRRRANTGRGEARTQEPGPPATTNARATSEPREGGKRRRAGDKRERILKAAVKVFARSGFHATRVSDIAKAAGVADGTIYLYFESKDELLLSLFEDRVGKLLTFMREELPKLPIRRRVSVPSSTCSLASSLASAIWPRSSPSLSASRHAS